MTVRKKANRLRPFNPGKTGGWSRRDATHLLWRTQYGASLEEIERVATAGLQPTLDRLLLPQSESAEFQSTQSLLRQTAHDTGNIADLKGWWLYRMLYSANPVVEKMSLFWHNHFATSYTKVQSIEHMSVQNDFIRQHAVGSFRKLFGGMARDVAMLIWLDGNANRRRQANENFAREVMELFSLGEGHYTENDIKEAARAFTGWHVRDEQFWFNQRQHDTSDKTLFGRTGNLNGEDVIELCLKQTACPRFLAVKLLRAFVTPKPDAQLIEQFAGRIRAHDFEMTPVLRELFGSEAFFDAKNRHTLIKSPLELVLGTFRTLGSRPNLQTATRVLAELGQDIFEPPTVKGWEGGRLWINSATLLKRANFAAEFCKGSRLGSIADPNKVAESHGWKTSDEIVRHYAELLLARDLGTEALDRLAEYLRSAQGNRNLRLRGLIHLIMTMPEYQLC